MSDWEQRAEDAKGSGGKLNAGAKSFSFNPNARSFVPGPAAPAPAPSTEGTYVSSLTGGVVGRLAAGLVVQVARWRPSAARLTFL